MKKRIGISILMIAFLICATIMPSVKVNATQSRSSNFQSVNLTGDPAGDMSRIATAQDGKTKEKLGYTENWAADFVSDCAKIAGQSEAIPFNGDIDKLYSAVINAGGEVVTSPKCGDLVFYRCIREIKYVHVGIMSGPAYSIQGDVKKSGENVSRCLSNQLASKYTDAQGHSTSAKDIKVVYVRPKYKSTADTEKPKISNIKITETNEDYFEVSYECSDNVGIVKEEVLIFCPDAKVYAVTHKEKIANGTRTQKFTWYDYPDGLYYIEVTLWDEAGNKVSQYSPNIKKESDIMPPKITNVKVTDVSESGYTVTCTVTDNIEVSEVRFATWTETNGQDDILYTDGVINGNTVTCKIKTSDHKGQLDVNYLTFIYAYDKAGNVETCSPNEYSDLCVYIRKEIVLDRTNITELTNSRQRTMTVKYDPVKNRLGYQIEYSTDNKFKDKSRVNTGATSKDIGKLTKGKTYYVRVRAYARYSDGTLTYSKWSGTRKVKITK